MLSCKDHDWQTRGQPPLKSCTHCGKIWSAPLPTYGALGFAPCGHQGMAVIGHYYTCLKGCDAVPEHVNPEITRETTSDTDDDVDSAWMG